MLRGFKPRRLIVLFGCGGNRSKLRRSKMGETAGHLADLTILTSDNPRWEDPEEILDDIEDGIRGTGGQYVRIADRRKPCGMPWRKPWRMTCLCLREKGTRHIGRFAACAIRSVNTSWWRKRDEARHGGEYRQKRGGQMAEYAKVIVDISQEKLDKTFEYRIPPYLTQRIAVGMQVYIPFGSRRITGYVVELSDEAEYDEDKLKNIAGIVTDSVPIESHLIALAGWMREHYGGTMNQALKMVLPIKEKKKAVEHKRVRLALHPVEAKNQLGAYERRHSTARARLLRALLEEEELDWDLVTHKLGVSGSVIRAMEESGVVKVIRETQYRNPVSHPTSRGYGLTLNDEQQEAVDAVWSDYEKGIRSTYLIKGVTGSGKTEVYMELIAKMQKAGRQAIVPIPEIALTYQTVLRFYNRFGDRVSILNSRMSPGGALRSVP